jgi:hypothetical protein
MPSLEELDQVLKQIIQRVTRYLEKQKIIIRDEEGQKGLGAKSRGTHSTAATS